MLADSLVALLQKYPRISHLLPLKSFLLLFRLLQCLRTHLAWHCGTADPGFIPLALSIKVKDFLAGALQLDGPVPVKHAVLDDCWFALGGLVWQSVPSEELWRSKELVDLFAEFGFLMRLVCAFGLAMHELLICMYRFP